MELGGDVTRRQESLLAVLQLLFHKLFVEV